MARDIVIAAFGNSPENDKALEKGVLSLNRFAEGLGRILVIGDVLSNVPAGVEKFYVEPLYTRGSMYDNAIYGVLKAMQKGVIAIPSLFMPLKMELTEKVVLDEVKQVGKGKRIQSIADLIRANKGGAIITKYRYVLSSTRDVLERNGYMAEDYSGKQLSLIDPIDYKEVQRVWIEEPHGEFGYDVACLFGNIREKRVR